MSELYLKNCVVQPDSGADLREVDYGTNAPSPSPSPPLRRFPNHLSDDSADLPPRPKTPLKRSLEQVERRWPARFVSGPAPRGPSHLGSPSMEHRSQSAPAGNRVRSAYRPIGSALPEIV